MKGFLTLLALLVSCINTAAPVKSNLGARQINFIESQEELTYVQDGLVAMLDGSDGLSEDGWTDLVSGIVCPLGGSLIVGNHIEITDSTGFSMAPLELEKMYSGDGCTEIDVDISGLSVFASFFGVGANRFYIYCWGPKQIYVAAYGGTQSTFARKQSPVTYAFNFDNDTKDVEVYEDGILKTTVQGTTEKALWFNYLRMTCPNSKIRGIRVYNRMLSQDEIVNNNKVSARKAW